MTPAVASFTALALLALPAAAGQHHATFRVGATVFRSARVTTDASGTRLTLAGTRGAAVQVDSSAARLVAVDEVALPDGTRQVTVHY
jgi:hypothetical protein